MDHTTLQKGEREVFYHMFSKGKDATNGLEVEAEGSHRLATRPVMDGFGWKFFVF